MKYLTYDDAAQQYPIAILVPAIHKQQIHAAYIQPYSLNESEVVVFDLYQTRAKKKTPIKEIKEYLEELSAQFEHWGCQYLLVGDGEYFKLLAGTSKVDANVGYVLPIAKEYGQGINVIYVPNYKAIFYDPKTVTQRISAGVSALLAHRLGCYCEPGFDIIKSAKYLYNPLEIEQALNDLLERNAPLACDIEGFSLRPDRAGIGTIAFAWDKHNGIAIQVDYAPDDTVPGFYGKLVRNDQIRALLRRFFERFNNTVLYHNASYDVSVMIYQLFMSSIIDTQGLLTGLNVMLKNWEDTKLITYLATNSCAGNDLSLKTQAQEFAGNWAQDDIKDIRKIPLKNLLQYNLVDGLSTHYVFEKWADRVVADDQLEIYQTIFKPAIVDIIQMQLTGLPLNMQRVIEVEAILQADLDGAVAAIQSSPLVQQYVYQANENWVVEKNLKLKKKRVTLDDAKEVFNPASPLQVQKLLYEQIGLPVIELTDSKQPATGGKVLKALKNHTTDADVLALLDGLIDYKAVDKILGSFIPAFKDAYVGPDGWHYLCGNFNLGGTVSGRLSSSNPNLQNLPSGGRYGKLIKSCFQAPPGWLFVGLDFASLEDRISALTTKDPNKLRVYVDLYDGHCLRAFAYFGDHMPDIEQAPKGAECYKAKIGNTEICFHEHESIEYLGQTMTGRELYEFLTSQGL